MKIAQDQISARREEHERSIQSFRRFDTIVFIAYYVAFMCIVLCLVVLQLFALQVFERHRLIPMNMLLHISRVCEDCCR